MQEQLDGVTRHLLNQIADYSYKLAIVSAELIAKQEELDKVKAAIKKKEEQKNGGGDDHKKNV